jgi:thiamine biosynthesis lipoprotein
MSLTVSSSEHPSKDESIWLRRARPLLGTLVEVGVPRADAAAQAAVHAAFEAMALVQARMSVFEAASDLSRCHASPVDQGTVLHPWTAHVLAFARDLQERSSGLFDVALGSGAWHLRQEGDDALLYRDSDAVRLDLGGLAKGWAVDKAIEAAIAMGVRAVWVNAGGDLRVHGVALPIALRDELQGGVRPWGTLEDGALATSDFRPGARATLAGTGRGGYLSVAAPRCAWADALTKVLAQCAQPDQGMAADLLRHYRAQVWVHERRHT